MGETDKHRELMAYLIAALKAHFSGQPNVYVSGNNFVFWEEGKPKSRVSPDTYVVFGAEMRLRDSYMAWKEGGLLPDVVFEVTSRATQREDVETKLPLYEQVLKTPEYFLFDPTGDYLRPRLQGYRLQDGRYVRLELVNDRLHSEQLGLDLVQQGEALRLLNPATGEVLPTALEQAERLQDAEAEMARLRTEIETLKKLR
jgi:Uma2 family endonuclease